MCSPQDPGAEWESKLSGRKGQNKEDESNDRRGWGRRQNGVGPMLSSNQILLRQGRAPLRSLLSHPPTGSVSPAQGSSAGRAQGMAAVWRGGNARGLKEGIRLPPDSVTKWRRHPRLCPLQAAATSSVTWRDSTRRSLSPRRGSLWSAFLSHLPAALSSGTSRLFTRGI